MNHSYISRSFSQNKELGNVTKVQILLQFQLQRTNKCSFDGYMQVEFLVSLSEHSSSSLIVEKSTLVIELLEVEFLICISTSHYT